VTPESPAGRESLRQITDGKKANVCTSPRMGEWFRRIEHHK
jgi:hypothetical protein